MIIDPLPSIYFPPILCRINQRDNSPGGWVNSFSLLLGQLYTGGDIWENNQCVNISAENFFNALVKNSIHIQEFNESENYYSYHINKFPLTTINNNFYTTPFYEDSQDISEKIIKDKINKASKRVYVCAQHISAYEYKYPQKFKDGSKSNKEIKREGFLADVLKKAKDGLDVKLLSQTFVDENGNNYGCRKPENKYAFMEFIREYKKCPHSFYAVNDSVHCKFIVADDCAIITTCNFTPTQFIYLGHVKIDKFTHIPNMKYSGIHSEVGQYLIMEDEKICNELINFFNQICNRKDTFLVSVK